MANSGRLSNFAKPGLSTAAKKRTRTNKVADATNIPAAMMLRQASEVEAHSCRRDSSAEKLGQQDAPFGAGDFDRAVGGKRYHRDQDDEPPEFVGVQSEPGSVAPVRQDR
jgi:hypothetical protein